MEFRGKRHTSKAGSLNPGAKDILDNSWLEKRGASPQTIKMFSNISGL